MKTGIYIRVSTEEQAKEGFSIRAQQEKLMGYIEIKDWELYDIYIYEGISGKNITERPAINRLIADVLQGKVQNVLVFKIDRLTRSTKDLISLMDLFNEKDCAFNSLMENIDTRTPSGRMFIKIIGIFAEFERENLIERVTVAFEKKVREGYTISSFAVPYGYNRIKKERNITINEEESKIVKEIFTLYLDKHKSLNAIAKELNMRNIQAPSGLEWGNATIKYILTNPIYMGKVRYAINDENRYFEADGKHEAVISSEMFAKVQNKLAKMQKTIKKRPKEENYYCGTLMCGICGGRMTTHGHYLKDKDGNESYYCNYICIAKNQGKCNASSMSHNKVDITFRDYIENIASFTVEHEIDIDTDNSTINDIETIRTEYEKSLSELLQKEKDIMRLYIADKIDFNEYNKMLELIRGEIKAYGEKISELETVQDTNVGLSKEDIVTNFKENWDSLTKLEKMQFLHTYIKAIYAVSEADNQNEKKKHVKVKKIEYSGI